MPNFLQIESESERLRQALRLAPSPELETVCILKFFSGLKDELPGLVEPYFKEFIPKLTVASQKADPREFLPADAAQLSGLLEFLGGLPAGICSSDDLEHLQTLHRKISDCLRAVHNGELIAESDEKGNGVSLKALFVEHFPELGLDPRGRILTLRVSAERISPRNETDDVDIRNPLLKSNDSFLKQARDSAAAARKYLEQSHNLPSRRRYRINFHVDHTGARFTGDSLGVAFAVGAVAAIARLEVLREKISVAPDAVFSGALSAEGKILPIDAQGLKLKIFRAFHSGLKYLVIPRQHIDDCWGYLKELESPYPRRKLELYGVEELPSVLSDPRFVKREKVPTVIYASKRALLGGRKSQIEIPILLLLTYALVCFIYPKAWVLFDWNPARFELDLTNNKIIIQNSKAQTIRKMDYPCRLNELDIPGQAANILFYNLNKVGHNELLLFPASADQCYDRQWLYCYSWDDNVSYEGPDNLLFKRFCAVPNEYPGLEGMYESVHLRIFEINSEPIIVTTTFLHAPARGHIRIWNAQGDSLGWYINAGSCNPFLAYDLNQDGTEEIFSINYYYREPYCASLLVLRHDSTFGCSPPYILSESGLDFRNVERGTQLAYLLFPTTDISRAVSTQPLNQPGGPRPIVVRDRNHVAIYVLEGVTANQHLIYILDSSYRVTDILFCDQFTKLRDSLAAEPNLVGKIPSLAMTRNEFTQYLIDTVTYWTDSGWVTEGQLRAAENLKKSSKISK